MIPVSVGNHPGTGQSEAAAVLLLCAHATNRRHLRKILDARGLKIYDALGWAEGAAAVARYRPQVIICEAILPDADWKDVLFQTALLRDAPKLIVISSYVDDSLGSEVLHFGGYDVLLKPLVEDEVVRVVGLAWQNWTNERDRRREAVWSAPEKGETK